MATTQPFILSFSNALSGRWLKRRGRVGIRNFTDANRNTLAADMSVMTPLIAPQPLTLGILGAAFLLLSQGTAAPAAVLVNNGTPDLQLAIRSDFGFPVEAGDDFTLSERSNLTRVIWSGLYASDSQTSGEPATVSQQPTNDRFSVRLFEFLTDRPAIAPIAAFNHITVSRTPVPQNQFFYNYSFTPTQSLTLNAGRYLLSVVNDTTADATLDWFWARSKLVGNNFGRYQPTDPWFDDRNNTAELSFTLEGSSTAVPTPALLPGLIGLGIGVWRKWRLAAGDRRNGNP